MVNGSSLSTYISLSHSRAATVRLASSDPVAPPAIDFTGRGRTGSQIARSRRSCAWAGCATAEPSAARADGFRPASRTGRGDQPADGPNAVLTTRCRSAADPAAPPGEEVSDRNVIARQSSLAGLLADRRAAESMSAVRSARTLLGTCRMGAEDDPMAVTITGGDRHHVILCADASITCRRDAHQHQSAIHRAIGERVADLLQQR